MVVSHKESENDVDWTQGFCYITHSQFHMFVEKGNAMARLWPPSHLRVTQLALLWEASAGYSGKEHRLFIS